tara:strand:- start:1344 stop:2015 length:672 start_codon:yes stop_codon:yes gene_type:complete
MDNTHVSILLNQQNLLNNYINYLNTCNRTINRLQDDLINQYNNYNRQSNPQTYNHERYNEEIYNQETYNQETYNQVRDSDYNYIYNSLSLSNGVIDNDYFKNLSNQNIENIIHENIEFKKYKDIINPINDKCGISQEDFVEDDVVGIFKICGHIFTKDNLLNWSRRHLSCPNCRNNLLYNTNYIKYSEIDNLNINNLDNVCIFTQEQLARYISWKLYNTLFSN